MTSQPATGSRILKIFPIILIFPAVALVVFLVIFPLIWALGLSFYSYNVLRGEPPIFVGVENYYRLLNSLDVWRRFVLTGQFVFYSVSIEFLLGFGLAHLFYNQFRGRRLAITLVTTPLLVAPVAVGIFHRYLFDATFGIYSYIAQLLTGQSVRILSQHPMFAIVFMDVWQWSPFMMLFILAGLEAIPKHMLESSEIDRLSPLAKFRYIVWPTIKPLVALALLFRTMDAFRTFDTIFTLTGGGPGTATEVLSIQIYRTAFQFFRTGEATALAFIFLVIILLLTNIYLRLARRE
ncbi:MAG: sugar ABC transporter permease [Nitrososphaerota archaeon]